MQPNFRPFQQPPQRSPHAPPSARRGIGPMISGAHPQNSLTPTQMQAQQAAQIQASDRARLRSRKPTDKNLPDGIEDCIIGDGVQRYRDLRDIERRLDSTMTRKRLDIQDSVNRNVKRYRTLRIWISNTVEDQPWQAESLDVDAFDFSTSIDSSYRVKIEGRLLDDEDEALESDDEDEDDGEGAPNGEAMDEDPPLGTKNKKPQTKEYKFSHFFKTMTVDFDRNKGKDSSDQSVEWKKPVVAPNNPLPTAADIDQLEFKRGGDENMNITINLVRDQNPEIFSYHPALADILDTKEGTRAEAVMGVWEYIKLMGLQEDDDKRSFDCDDRLRALVQREKGYIPYLPDIVNNNIATLAPVKLQYTIRVDKEFHENPEATIYDVRVQVDDPLKAALSGYLNNPGYAQSLREIININDHLAILVQKISNSNSKHTFFDSLSKNPTEFIARWLSSQKRDLEIIAGEAGRGGGEDATGDEWRRGGKDSIWGSEIVRESVTQLVNRPKP